jgi:general L-amino acid transport system permease protein
MKPGIWRWCRRNLFATPFDSALSLIFIPVCAWAMGALVYWAAVQAQWHVVADNLRVLMVGTYPGDLMSRPWISTVILALLSGATMGAVVPPKPRRTALALLALAAAAVLAGASGHVALGWTSATTAVALAAWLGTGVLPPLRKLIGPGWLIGLVAIGVVLSPAGVERWGGLLMGVVFTLLASLLSVPLGIGLALGRRSNYASARILCTGYIEVMRSLPLILIVYWVWIISPLVAPDHPVPDLVRGLIGFTLFFAAYVAEYVRSGLQGIPRGQVEAAQSLGMAPAAVNRDIVLPQAIRVVMPALVGNVLDIFNNVPLLFIIGLTDFLRAGQMVLVNPQSGNRTYELYAFMFVVYLAVASLITYGARRLETRMALGHR